MILLDTDICVGLLRGNRTVVERRRATSEQVGIAGMSVGELFFGAEKSARPEENRAAVEQFIVTLPILHTTCSILRAFGRLKAQLERAGTPLADADVLIAATALVECDLLVTGNTAHFSRFPGLRLGNWLRVGAAITSHFAAVHFGS